MNKLDEIINNAGIQNGAVKYPFSGREALTVKQAKEIAIEFAKHILNEAAESADIINHTKVKNAKTSIISIDKNSIISIINKYL